MIQLTRIAGPSIPSQYEPLEIPSKLRLLSE